MFVEHACVCLPASICVHVCERVCVCTSCYVLLYNLRMSSVPSFLPSVVPPFFHLWSLLSLPLSCTLLPPSLSLPPSLPLSLSFLPFIPLVTFSSLAQVVIILLHAACSQHWMIWCGTTTMMQTASAVD